MNVYCICVRVIGGVSNRVSCAPHCPLCRCRGCICRSLKFDPVCVGGQHWVVPAPESGLVNPFFVREGLFLLADTGRVAV